MKTFGLAVDMPNNPKLIAQYIEHHKNVWPEVLDSIRDSGINNMKIYHIGNRLFMHLTTTEEFTFVRKERMDQSNEIVMKWEALMSEFQIPVPWANEGEKWTLMTEIFNY